VVENVEVELELEDVVLVVENVLVELVVVLNVLVELVVVLNVLVLEDEAPIPPISSRRIAQNRTAAPSVALRITLSPPVPDRSM